MTATYEPTSQMALYRPASATISNVYVNTVSLHDIMTWGLQQQQIELAASNEQAERRELR